MTQMAAQDAYPDDMAQCYGCGRLNHEGYQLKTRWDGNETLTIFTPRPYHTAMPGYVYGGLLASVIDCHGTGSGALAAYREAGREVGSEPAFRFVTAGLKVDYLKPTPFSAGRRVRARPGGGRAGARNHVSGASRNTVTGPCVQILRSPHPHPWSIR